MKNKLKKIIIENNHQLNESDNKNPFLECDSAVSKCVSALNDLYAKLISINTPKANDAAKQVREMYESIHTYTPSSRIFKMDTKMDEEIEASINVDDNEKRDLAKLAKDTDNKLKFVKENKKYKILKEVKINSIDDLFNVELD